MSFEFLRAEFVCEACGGGWELCGEGGEGDGSGAVCAAGVRDADGGGGGVEYASGWGGGDGGGFWGGGFPETDGERVVLTGDRVRAAWRPSWRRRSSEGRAS